MESSEIDPEIKQILLRAGQIDQEENTILRADPRYREVLDAATEAGYSRESVLQALKERLTERQAPEADQGQVIFAKSSDGAYYGAVVVKPMGDFVRVRFLNGSEAAVSWAEIKPFTLTPGQSLQAQGDEQVHGNFWWKAQVVRVNPISRSVTVRQWGSDRTLPLESVRIPSEDRSHWLQELTGNKSGIVMLVIILASVLGLAILTGTIIFVKGGQPPVIVAPPPSTSEAKPVDQAKDSDSQTARANPPASSKAGN